MFLHNQQLWASASEPTGIVPTTQFPERKVGTIAITCQGVLNEDKRKGKRVGFDGWMVFQVFFHS